MDGSGDCRTQRPTGGLRSQRYDGFAADNAHPDEVLPVCAYLRDGKRKTDLPPAVGNNASGLELHPDAETLSLPRDGKIEPSPRDRGAGE